MPADDTHRRGRLTVRATPPVAPASRTGLLTFDGSAGEVRALAYVPGPADAGPYRLAVLLHGAGGAAEHALDLMRDVADTERLLLVAPQSTGRTWDLIVSGLGPDVRRIDDVIAEIVRRYPVDLSMIGGFSDGASYALSLGLVNGDVFDAVVAFSPGFAAPLMTNGHPRVFVSHGVHDAILPVDRCSRRLVPRLLTLGYEVTYLEFDGGHEVPGTIARRAVTWLTRSGSAN